MRQLVYSDSGRAIRTVLVDGKVVIRDRPATRVDECALREELARVLPDLRIKVRTLRERYSAVRLYFEAVQTRAWARPLRANRFVG